MNNKILVVAQVLAVMAIALSLLTEFGIVGALGVEEKITGPLGFMLAIAAFLFSMGRESALIAVLLMLQGGVMMAVSFTAGAEIGIVFGAVVLVLGAVKGLLYMRILSRVGKDKRRA